MVVGGTELEMRGRCSAGQKVGGLHELSWRVSATRPSGGQQHMTVALEHMVISLSRRCCSHTCTLFSTTCDTPKAPWVHVYALPRPRIIIQACGRGKGCKHHHLSLQKGGARHAQGRQWIPVCSQGSTILAGHSFRT